MTEQLSQRLGLGGSIGRAWQGEGLNARVFLSRDRTMHVACYPVEQSRGLGERSPAAFYPLEPR